MSLLQKTIRIFEKISALAILFIMAVTCVDIAARQFGASLHGAYDLVRIGGGIAIAAALPVTTAVKGHVAIEYFFHRLSTKGRLIVDSLMRTLQTLLFLFAAFAFVRYGNRLLQSGEVTPTLECPTFFLSWIIALSCFITAAISLFHLICPRTHLIKP